MKFNTRTVPYIYIYIHIHTYIHTHTNTHMQTHICVYIYMHTYTQATIGRFEGARGDVTPKLTFYSPTTMVHKSYHLMLYNLKHPIAFPYSRILLFNCPTSKEVPDLPMQLTSSIQLTFMSLWTIFILCKWLMAKQIDRMISAASTVKRTHMTEMSHIHTSIQILVTGPEKIMQAYT